MPKCVCSSTKKLFLVIYYSFKCFILSLRIYSIYTVFIYSWCLIAFCRLFFCFLRIREYGRGCVWLALLFL